MKPHAEGGTFKRNETKDLQRHKSIKKVKKTDEEIMRELGKTTFS